MKNAVIFAILAMVFMASAFSQTLPDTPLPMPVPVQKTSVIDKVFKVAAWPGYGEAGNDKLQKTLLLSERGANIFDSATTMRLLSFSSSIPGHYFREGDPLNTAFGNRDRAGVLASEVGLELAYSHFSSVLPRWMEQRWGKRGEVIGRTTSRLVGMYLTEEHVRCGVKNIQLWNRSMQEWRGR